MLLSRFNRKVSFALMLIDAYTEEIIQNKVGVSGCSGLYKPIKKADGYFVFVNIETEGTVSIDIKSDIYEQDSFEVNMSQINPARPIVKYVLTPKKQYLPKGTASIQGKAEPGDKISVIYGSGMNLYKLLYDIKKSESSIQIYNPANRNLEDEEFAVINKTGKIVDIIKLGIKNSDGSYETGAFKKGYKKTEHSLIRAVSISAKETGEYFYPIKGFDEKINGVSVVYNDDLSTLKSARVMFF